MSEIKAMPQIKIGNKSDLLESTLMKGQKAFIDNDESKFMIITGNVGTGKTTALAARIIKELWQYPDNFGFVLGNDYDRLRKGWIRDFLDLIPDEMFVSAIKNIEGTYEIVVNNGHGGESSVMFASWQEDSPAIQNVDSSNLGFFSLVHPGIEQLDLNERLIMRLRRNPSSRRAFYETFDSDWLNALPYAIQQTTFSVFMC